MKYMVITMGDPDVHYFPNSRALKRYLLKIGPSFILYLDAGSLRARNAIDPHLLFGSVSVVIKIDGAIRYHSLLNNVN